mgnify:CR=1 FL=1
MLNFGLSLNRSAKAGAKNVVTALSTAPTLKMRLTVFGSNVVVSKSFPYAETSYSMGSYNAWLRTDGVIP